MAVSFRSEFSLISIVLLTGLSFLAWISTYTGILELIAASAGNVSLFARIAIGFAVLMLQLMILYILDAMFSGRLRWFIWPLYIVGYIILFIISVGFAFGFYWKYLEAGSVTTQAAEFSVSEVERNLQIGQSRLEQLQTTFSTLARISAEKAETERTAGRTCPNSPPGDGPRRRLREGDAQRFQYADQFIAQQTANVKNDIAALNLELQKIVQKDPSTIDPATGSRNAFITELNRKLNLTTTRFNALRTDAQLQQLRDEFKQRADKTTFSDDRGGTFSCPDPQLQTALNGVVRAIDELPQLARPELKAYEGSEAVIEAFRRLSTSGIGWAKQIGTVFGGQAPPIEGGLTDRDFVPLIIAIFVDVCILLISINRPFGPFIELAAGMREGRRDAMSDVLGTFYEVFQDEFDPKAAPSPLDILAPIQDVVFDHKGRYYAAVPLDFREDNYRDWLEARNIRYDLRDGGAKPYDPNHPGSFKPLETSRYISGVFVVLEGKNIVRLVEIEREEEAGQEATKDKPEQAEADGALQEASGEGGSKERSKKIKTDRAPQDRLTYSLIKDKLDRQGSVYAQADAFRLYRFEKKMYAELMLRSVGSTAYREERRVKAGHRAPPRNIEQPPQLAGSRKWEFKGHISGVSEPKKVAETQRPALTHDRQSDGPQSKETDAHLETGPQARPGNDNGNIDNRGEIQDAEYNGQGPDEKQERKPS